MTVFEIKAGKTWGEFGPEPVDAEIALRFDRIVKKDYGAVAEFAAPGFEVDLYRVIGVQAVNVQQVDGGVGDVRQSLVKGHAIQDGKSFVVAMEPLQIKKYGFFVVVGVDVAQPSVNGVAAGGEFQFGHGLAEGTIGDAVLGAEFDQDTGAQHFGERHGEGDVLGPAGFFVHSLRETIEELPIERIEFGGHAPIVHEMELF